MRKPILLAALGAILVLATVLGGGTQQTRAFVAPGIQDFDVDMVHCLLPAYPPDNLSPNPMDGPYQVCAAGEDKLVGPRPAGAALSTGVALIEGNRLGYPYVYSGPGWGMKADTPADYGKTVGDVASLTDLFQNGAVDVTGDASNCGGNPTCSPALDLTTAIPEDYLEQTTAWGAGTGCTGEDESYLTQAMPGATAMTKYVRYRACIDTLFLGGTARITLAPPTPLNLVTLTPNWSPAGTHVNLVLLSGAANSPTTVLQGIDSPLASISHTLTPYTDNPAAPGLYVRWMTELSAGDEGDEALSFVYTTNCKAIGGSFTDADADCLADTAVDPGWAVAAAGAAQGPFTLTNTHLGPAANRLDVTFDVTLAGTVTGATVTGEPAACTALGSGARKVELSNNTVIVYYTSNCVPSPGGQIALTISTSAGVATTGAVVWHTVDTNPSPTTGFDTDSDGLLDGVEWAWGSDPSLANTDADGRTDLEEMIGPTQLLTDPTKADTDGDGIIDGGHKVDLYDTPSTGCQTSGDPDGKPDFPDENGDSICDTGMSANQDPLNGITDGSSHVRVGFKIVGRDILADGAGRDNCPSTPNADQKNTDFDNSLVFNPNRTGLGNGDLYGDACDGDDDNDETPDGAEVTNGYSAGQCNNLGGAATLPLNPDSDGDTVLDGVECFLGTNPDDVASKPAPATSGDADKDGLTSGFETYQRSQSFSDQRAPRPVGSEDVDVDTLIGDNDFDSDNDGMTDPCEALATGTSLLRADTDGDGVLDIREPNARSNLLEIGNGTGIAAPDTTVPSSATFDCTNDADRDGLLNVSDPDPGGDITYDDNGDGAMMSGTVGGITDDGPSWDSDADGILDGWVGSCGSATADADGDGLKDAWENCKWGTYASDPDGAGGVNPQDSDGDGTGDCTEAVDTNGNNIILGDFGGDGLNSARATLLPAGVGAGRFGKDGDFDLNGNMLVAGDFGADTLTTARMTLGIWTCQ